MKEWEFQRLLKNIRSNGLPPSAIRIGELEVYKTEIVSRGGRLIESNKLDDESYQTRIRKVATAIISNTNVKYLDASHVPEEGIKCLLNSLLYNKSGVNHVNLHGCTIGLSMAENIKISTSVIHSVVGAVMSSDENASENSAEALDNLALAADARIARICDLLVNSTYVMKLDLTWTLLHTGDALKLFAALEWNITLQSLILDRNWIGDDSAEEITKFLKKNLVLQELSLKKNCFHDQSAGVIAKAFLVNKTLKHLYMEENEFTTNGLNVLNQVSSFNNVVEVHVSGKNSEASCCIS